MLDVIWLLPAVPLAGFVILVLFGRRLGEPLAGWLGTAACAARPSCWPSSPGSRCSACRPRSGRSSASSTSGCPSAGCRSTWRFLADQLSIAMALFVTGVGALIHLYSIGYMHGDPKFSKFFVYLNLFVFSMLMLVLGENLVVTFLGWEGVGVCSYLLVSFWHTRDRAAGRPGRRRSSPPGSATSGSCSPCSSPSRRSARSTSASSTRPRTAARWPSSTANGIAAAAVRRRRRQVGPAPAVPLAARRHGGPDAGLRADPRRHHGDGRRVPDGAGQPGAGRGDGRAGRHRHRRRRSRRSSRPPSRVAQNDIKKVLAYSTVSQLGYMFLAVGVRWRTWRPCST